MTDTVLRNYLDKHHPQILGEVADKLKSIECTPELVTRVKDKAQSLGFDIWETKLITLSTVLVLCSPETIHVNTVARKNVCKLVANEFGVSTPAVSKYIGQAKYYYLNISWVTVEVDKIVSQVNSTTEVNSITEIKI